MSIYNRGTDNTLSLRSTTMVGGDVEVWIDVQKMIHFGRKIDLTGISAGTVIPAGTMVHFDNDSDFAEIIASNAINDKLDTVNGLTRHDVKVVDGTYFASVAIVVQGKLWGDAVDVPSRVESRLFPNITFERLRADAYEKLVGGVTLNKTNESMNLGGSTLSITATTDPAGKDVTWTSSDESVATVSSGTVTAVGPGTCVITASATIGGEVKSASCAVAVNGVVLNKSTLSIEVDASEQLTATVYPTDATITWASSATAKAEVANGLVTGKAAGSSNVSASITVGGSTLSATCAVTVTS